MNSSRFLPGFTLIELLVSASIILLLTGMGVAAYNRFNESQTLKQEAEDLRNNLRLAQAKALSQEKPASCTGSLAGYEVSFPNNTEYQILARCGNTISLAQVKLKGGVRKTSGNFSVLFKLLGQGVDISGGNSVILTLGSNSQTVTVLAGGEIR